MDAFENLIEWGLQMSLKYQKYLERLPKLSYVQDKNSCIAHYLMPELDDPMESSTSQWGRITGFPILKPGGFERREPIPSAKCNWRGDPTVNPGMFLCCVNYGAYSIYTDDFADFPTFMGVKFMSYEAYDKMSLYFNPRGVDDSCVSRGALYFGSDGRCVMDPLSQLDVVEYALQLQHKMEIAIKARINAEFGETEIPLDEKEKELLEDNKWMRWSTTWNADFV